MRRVVRKRRKYRINKVKFARFIIISLAFIALMVWLFSLMINAIYNMVFKHDETANVNNVTNIDVVEVIPVSSQVYASDCITCEIEETNKIDYSKKPEGLEDTYYKHVIEISDEENVPSEVILAIMTTENELYDVNATCKNSNGTIDMGLCQINSSYVDYFADTYDIENLDPYNAEDAITFVARHMKYLSNYAKDKYDLSEKDSYIFAAGAYNRGLGNECKYRNMYEYKEKFIKNYEKFI